MKYFFILMLVVMFSVKANDTLVLHDHHTKLVIISLENDTTYILTKYELNQNISISKGSIVVDIFDKSKVFLCLYKESYYTFDQLKKTGCTSFRRIKIKKKYSKKAKPYIIHLK